jgi:hypothetical protein
MTQERHMTRIFFAYDSRDRELARILESGLEKQGHQSVWGVDELIAGRGWGELMPRRIASADAVVAILTPNSQNSSSVLTSHHWGMADLRVHASA